MSWVAPTFLAFAACSLLICVVSSLSIRRPIPFLIIPVFIFGLLSTELAWFFLAFSVALTLVFSALGALEQGSGQLALLLMALTWLGLWRLHRESHQADEALGRALCAGLGEDFRASIPSHRQAVLRDTISTRDWLRPFTMSSEGVERLVDIPYADAGERNLLDIYRPLQAREGGFPVLLQVHGGGWFSGHKQQQALPLLHHLAQRGWICVSINYRLSPDHKFPAHIVDVKKAIAWIKQHIAEYGGDPSYIAITGGSAGGHLTSLAALTPNAVEYQPGFEEVDTEVQAAVPLYGVYDFTDRDGKDLNASLRGFLADKVMPGPLHEYQELWNDASPVTRVHVHAPPFFVIHGDSDIMTSWEVARDFVTHLEQASDHPVAHAELPGAQHGFDGFHSVRTSYLVNHITDFLEWAHANRD